MQRGRPFANVPREEALHLTTVNKLRLTDVAGTLSVEEMRRVEQAVQVQLGLV